MAINKECQVQYESSDGSIRYQLLFISASPLKFNHLGKGWPKQTQCLMFKKWIIKAL